MAITRPFNFKKWIDDNRHLLKPPVGNQQVYKGNDDFIVMVVGGPNARKDYHYNEGEEFYYQVEGNIVLKIMENGKPVDKIFMEEKGLNILKKEDWPGLISFFKPRIIGLDEFWTNVKYGFEALRTHGT